MVLNCRDPTLLSKAVDECANRPGFRGRFQLVVAMGEDVGSWHGGAVWVGNLVGLMVGCVVR